VEKIEVFSKREVFVVFFAGIVGWRGHHKVNTVVWQVKVSRVSNDDAVCHCWGERLFNANLTAGNQTLVHSASVVSGRVVTLST
jgi:hypothetical protein